MWRALVAAAVIGTACNLPGDSAPSQTISGPSASPPGSVQSQSPNTVGGADREPRDLPRHSEESAVIEAIVAAGFDVAMIAASKFEEHLFAEWRRGRVFYNNYEKPFRVDALFLDSPPGNVRVCRLPGAGYDYSIVMDGRSAAMGATAEILFAVGDGFFVMTDKPAIHASLIARLRLTAPNC
jgi:hypothetical protein